MDAVVVAMLLLMLAVVSSRRSAPRAWQVFTAERRWRAANGQARHLIAARPARAHLPATSLGHISAMSEWLARR